MHTRSKAAAAHMAGMLITGAGETHLPSNDQDASLPVMVASMAALLGQHNVQQAAGMSSSPADSSRLPTARRQLFLPPCLERVPALLGKWPLEPSQDDRPGSKKILNLNCLVLGNPPARIFSIKIAFTETVADLKDAIMDKNKHTFPQIDVKYLDLWKVLIPGDEDLQANLDELRIDFINGKSLSSTKQLSEVFTESVLRNHLHVVVKSPTSGSSSVIVNTKTTENVLLKAPEMGSEVPRDAGTRNEVIDSFLRKLRPKIKNFLSHPRHSVWMPPDTVDENTREFYHQLEIPSIDKKPNLLLHNLGDADKTNLNGDTLFRKEGHHRILCNTSGAGQTAVIFNGLCSHWGFYFTAAQDANEIGARDLELAIEIMSQYQDWIKDVFKNPSDTIQNASDGNERIAFRWVFQVLLTRWHLFHTFIEVAKEQNAGNLPHNIKRDWLLFQIIPFALVDDKHPFLAFMNSCLVGMSTEDLLSSLSRFTPEGVLGSAFNPQSDNFFYVLDEAQIAGERYMGAFADGNGEIRRPVLRPIIKAWNSVTSNSIRFIVSGTGFSLSLFKTVLTSGVGKASPFKWTAVHQMGDFIDRDLQMSYITRYLPPAFLSSQSGTVLVSRMHEWLRGRHRSTATFIEQLLVGGWTTEGPRSPQKLLNAYVHVHTNFTPIDCDSALLANEPDIKYPKIEGFPWDKLKRDNRLLEELSSSLYIYITKGRYPSWFKEWQQLVEYGIARFIGNGELEEVIVEEPMALVGILRYFEAEGLSIDSDIRMRMRNGKGLAFEEAVLLSCSGIFQGGACLTDIFHFYGDVPDWAHQKGRIVSRRGQDRVFEDIVNGRPVLPSAGIAYYAEHADDVKDWITSKSNVWCIPGPLMGPDLMTWLQLDDGKLILLLIQAKCYFSGNKDTLVPEVTAKAIRSLIPDKFYGSLRLKSAEAKTSRMLNAINTTKECFTGARYNVLRVVAAYPLDAWIDPRRSKEIKNALNEDQHPLATFKHAPLISSLASRDGTPTILSSVERSLKRVRNDDEEFCDLYPKRKKRKSKNQAKKFNAQAAQRPSDCTEMRN